MMKLRMRVVDAFAARPFTGNPAGVCVLDNWIDDHSMQSIALEVNAAETAFMVLEGDAYKLRWFTPAAEVDLCGHATLASAHVLWEEGFVQSRAAIHFQTRSGLLTALRISGGLIQLDFPADRLTAVQDVGKLGAVLGSKIEAAMKFGRDYLVELSSDEDVRSLHPDLLAISRLDCQGVIVTAKSSEENFDFVSRYFAPSVGISEDPVTGSAHCTLGPYWRGRTGKESFVAYQASARGGIVGVKLAADRVLLSGQAITTIVGEITL